MKVIILISFLFGCALCDWFDGKKCTWQTSSYVLKDESITWINWPGISGDAWVGCWDDSYSCGSTKLEGSFTKKYKKLFTGESFEKTYSYESERKPGCIGNSACSLLAGGEDSCEYAEYTYQKWRPQSCNETADFDAITEDHDLKLYFTCCNGEDYCNKEVDYSSMGCTKSESFTSYMEELNTCWNKYKYDFMKDLLCDAELGDIFTYNDNCIQEDGSLTAGKRTDTSCRYRLQCAAELQELLVKFSSCACEAADDNGYTGEFIGSAMEANWVKFCPNVNVECAKDGLVKLLRKYYYVRYKFRVAVANAVVEQWKDALKEKIAARLNVAKERIQIILDGDSTTPETTMPGTSRRLLADTSDVSIQVDMDDTGTKNNYKTTMTLNKAAIASDIEDVLGQPATNTAVEDGEGEDTLTGTYDGDVTKNGVGSYHVIYGAVVAVLLSIIYQ